MKRRQFLGCAGAAATLSTAGTASALFDLFGPEARYRRLVPELFAHVPRPPSYVPVLIIGSGFGGAIAAYRLSQARIPVTVLERGQRWPTDRWREIHPPNSAPDGRSFWHRTRAPQPIGTAKIDYFGGVLDVTQYEHISVSRAACVGGGSKVCTGAMVQPEQAYFDALFGGLVDYREMNELYYPRVRQALSVGPMPGDIYQSASFRHSRIWDYQVTKAGYTPEPVDGFWNWSAVRDESRYRSRPSATAGESDHGNSNGAKRDLTQNYLKWAEDSGYTQVHAGMHVRGVSQEADGRYLVEVEQLDPMGEVHERFVVACRCLIMAAGSIGTTELLLKARELGELPRLNEHVGQGWGSNGDSATLRSFGSLPFDVRDLLDLGDLWQGMTQGAPCASSVLDTLHGMPVRMENWYVPLPVELTCIASLCLGFDTSQRASFHYDRDTDSTTLLWPKDGNADSMAVARALNERIAEAAGAAVGIPLLGGAVDGTFTGHPLGGVVLGKATDPYGRVAGYPGLYVMDSALIPGSTGAANPALTICALAERNMAELLKTDFVPTLG